MITIRQIRPDEGETFRAIRLQALTDSPDAFGSTLEETRARAREYWDGRATSGAAGKENVLFVAEDESGWIGVVGGFLGEDGGRNVHLVSMWVNRAYRRQGVAQRLVERIVDWARRRSAECVVLWVTESNGGEVSLYVRCGFQPTGETQPLPSNPALREQEMELALT